MVQTQEDIQIRYMRALNRFVDQVKQDSYIIAAILGGSLSHDRVWEKSDIDMLLICREDRKPVRTYALLSEGVNIHASILTRSKFKEVLESSLQSTFFHSYFSKSTLLFTTDDTIREYYDNVKHVGSRDRDMQLMLYGGYALGAFSKAEKWLYVKDDPVYSHLWITFTIEYLARIEVLLHNEVTGREVINQALEHNPTFFNAIYRDPAHQPKTYETIKPILDHIDAYLDERKDTLFKPLLNYLNEARGTRTSSEIEEYFKKKLPQDFGLSNAYEWLADKGILHEVSAPLRLTEKSRVTVDEAAYYYDGGEQP